MLRFYRKQAGLRQVDVAAKLGFTSYDRISHWENGVGFPCVTNLFRLAAIYRVSPHELYSEMWKDASNPTSSAPSQRQYACPEQATQI